MLVVTPELVVLLLRHHLPLRGGAAPNGYGGPIPHMTCCRNLKRCMNALHGVTKSQVHEGEVRNEHVRHGRTYAFGIPQA